jgi:hypothetical protein
MFFGDLTSVSSYKVATIGGKGHSASGMGTVKWSWSDDVGETHTYLVKDVLFFPASPINILSVTSFARQLQDEEGTGIDTKMKYSRFYWQGKFQRTICHPASNLPEMPINQGFSLATKFRAMVSRIINPTVKPKHSCCMVDLDHHEDSDSSIGQNCKHAFTTVTPPDPENPVELFEVGETLYYSEKGHSTLVKVKSMALDDDNVLRFTVTTSNNDEYITTREHLRPPGNPDIGWIPTSIPEFQSASRDLTEEEIDKITSAIYLSPLQQEFLSFHCKMFHLPYSIMMRMSSLGILPRRFLKLRNDLPPCISCLFGQAHRRPWRTKRSSKEAGGVLRKKDISEPGQTVGADQMVSAQPGLVPQEKGQMTQARVWGATIFVDYASKWVKVHLMTHATGEETLEAKQEFEHSCATRGVTPRHYHADNGRFAEPSFIKDCESKMQKVTFCGVGAHHQNGVAENTIKQLTLSSRTMLLHAQRLWPEYISTMLWPLALLAAADRMNHLHIDLDGKTPEMKFSSAANVTTRLRDFHTFGSPCYVLDSRLQSAGGPGAPKWEPRSRLGIYVGHSPNHAGSVALVLNPKTGLISPQFHVVFDDDFSTVPYLRKGTVPDNWAELVTNSRQKCTDGFYDVTKTWFDGTTDVPSGEANPPGPPTNSETLRTSEISSATAEPGQSPGPSTILEPPSISEISSATAESA